MIKIAFIAALEREVRPFIRHWKIIEREHEGRRYRFAENGHIVLLCAGIGAQAARRATEAAISLYSPETVCSIGFAGALHSGMKVGEGFHPSRVIDAGDGSSIETGGPGGALVSYGSIAGVEQKKRLARAYAAQAVDMEAAAVVRGAQARGVAFAAYKVISDESDFEMPEIDRFVQDGQFRTFAFVVHTFCRPWLWPRVVELAANSSRASHALCRWLAEYNCRPESLKNKPAELHPSKQA